MHRFLLPLLLFASCWLTAQSHEQLALTAYLSGQEADWQTALTATETITDPKTRLLTRAAYHQEALGVAMGREEPELADRHLDALEEAIDAYWKLDEDSAEAHARYSALLGFKIARKPMLGMIYGSRASKYARRAVELDPDHPAALMAITYNLYYTPEQWGGNKAAALTHIEKAAKNLPADWRTDYQSLSVLALYGQVLAGNGQTDAARAVYQKALAAQPDFRYVKRYLLPELDKAR